MNWVELLCWIEKHPGTASWVQAVGSVGAIVGAFAISNGQSRRHERLRKQESMDRFEAYYAVLKNAVESSISVAEFAEKNVADFEFRSVWGKYLGELLRASLEAAKAIPVHELSDYKLVMYYSGIMGTIYKLHNEVESYMASAPSMELTFKVYDDLKTQSSLIKFDWEQFQDRALPKRGQKKKGVWWRR